MHDKNLSVYVTLVDLLLCIYWLFFNRKLDLKNSDSCISFSLDKITSRVGFLQQYEKSHDAMDSEIFIFLCQ